MNGHHTCLVPLGNLQTKLELISVVTASTVHIVTLYLVVSMHHDHDTDGSGCEGPAVLPCMCFGASLRLKLDAKHLTEVLAKAMGGCPLHHTLDSTPTEKK